jgi:hypothetical protein
LALLPLCYLSLPLERFLEPYGEGGYWHGSEACYKGTTSLSIAREALTLHTRNKTATTHFIDNRDKVLFDDYVII